MNIKIQGIPNNLHKYDWNVILMLQRATKKVDKHICENNLFFLFCFRIFYIQRKNENDRVVVVVFFQA